MPVQRRRNAEGIGLGDRLAEEVDQRVVDGGVLDAGGGEKKLQGVLLRSRVGMVRPR
jgi:hypothetical protein